MASDLSGRLRLRGHSRSRKRPKYDESLEFAMSRLPLVAPPPLLGLAAMPAAESPAPAAPKGETLTKERASAFAKLALKGAKQQYPNKTGHVQLDDADTRTPRQLHPAFYGCYD